jgi:hypothetical protein
LRRDTDKELYRATLEEYRFAWDDASEPIGQGTSVKKFSKIQSRSLLCAVAGVLTVLMVAGGTKPATAQSSDAADRCTPDVMRLCNEFIPDADRIVVCLKAKRRQLTPSCLTALQPSGGKAKKRRARRR